MPAQLIGAQRIEGRDEPGAAALFALAQRRAERAPGFGVVAALPDRFFNVRLQLFVDLAA